jgi:hypothetical protein
VWCIERLKTIPTAVRVEFIDGMEPMPLDAFEDALFDARDHEAIAERDRFLAVVIENEARELIAAARPRFKRNALGRATERQLAEILSSAFPS